MTREEAKQWIENLIKTMRIETSGHYPDSAYKDEVYVALDMAVKALEQQLSDDAISRQAVIKLLSYDWANRPAHKAVESIRNLPSVTPKEKTDWTPVSERPPEEFESVLVCYKSQGGMAQAVSERFGTYTGYKWSALAGIEPIAWMPLPAPFEPQESEDKKCN